MPQTKPIMWTNFLISMNLLFLIMMVKMFQNQNKKKSEKKKIKKNLSLMKW